MALRTRYVRGGEFVCNRELDFHGRVFKVGDRLPWRDLEIHEVTLFLWWQQNLIDVAPAATGATIAVSPPVSPPVAKPPTKPSHQHRR